MAPAKASPIRIVIFIQENKTTDFYFPTLAGWGAEVVNLADRITVFRNGEHVATRATTERMI